jgi:hypothetical protein
MTNAVVLAQGAGVNLTNRNRIINGDMRIDQRNAGAAVTTGTYSYAADRFFLANQTDGAFSLQQVTDAPTEFTNSLKVTVTTADTSLSSAQRFVINHGLEGFNMADLAYGTANAKTTTLSFWVKSSVTGSYSVSLRAGEAGTGAAYATSYVINTANTWEYKSITIAGSTIGTWATTNACWAYLIFNLGIGSDFNITANTWVAGVNGQGISSDTSLVGTVNATWQVTGVQLEAGTVATPFEHRSYGQELALCQRYFEKTYDQSVVLGTATDLGCQYDSNSATVTSGGGPIRFAVTKRSIPTITSYSTNTGASGKVHLRSQGVDVTPSIDLIGQTGARVSYSQSSGIVNTTYHWVSSSEL